MTRVEIAILNPLNATRASGGALRGWFASGALKRPVAATANLLKRVDLKRISSRKILLTIAIGAVSALAMAAIRRHTGGTSADISVPARPSSAINISARRVATAARATDRSHAYSAEYNVLLTRSIFSSDGNPRGAGGASNSNGASSLSVSPIAPSTFALKGISQEDASFTAFIEDTSAGRMMQIHAGDTLGQGQVRDITMQNLNYEIGGKVVQIEIGQGLDGNPVVASARKPDSTLKPEHKHKHDAAIGDVRASASDGGN